MSARRGVLLVAFASLLWAAPSLAATGSPAPTAVEDIRDIRGPVPIPTWWRWMALAGGAVVVTAVAGVTIVAIRRRRRRPLEPHERALERLDAALPLAAAGQAHEYAVASSDAVRGYIEERFQLRAAHATTEEFFEDLIGNESSLLGDHRESLVHFLGACDLAKFARVSLPREGMASLHELARQFVLSTAPRSPAARSSRRAS